MSYRFDGKAVIVTGAANGIGLAIARRFVRAGAFVVFADRDERKLEAEVDAVNAEGHEGDALAFHGDVIQKLAMTNLMATVFEARDRLDVLVNAARSVHAGDPLDEADDGFDEILAQNVTANFRLSSLAARRMMTAGDGKADGAIVNVSSVYAHRAPPELLAYSVASAALNQLTRSLAVTLAPQGIRVNAVAVGSMPGRTISASLSRIDDLPRAFAKATPLGRFGQPVEAADAALFLAAPAASFITGEVLTVDGGRGLLDPLGA